MGVFLNQEQTVKGSADKISFYKNGRSVLDFLPHFSGQTIYWLESRIESAETLKQNAGIFIADYDIWHRHFGHPSKDVLRHAGKHTKNFPRDLSIPKESKLCPGCAQGKMPSKSFPPSSSRAKEPFELIHSDLKSFPVDSYHKYKYFISFVDDYSSTAWVSLLKKKSGAISALKKFVAMVDTQYNKKIKRWRSDAGGEYKSDVFDNALLDNGVIIEQSTPHTPQKNGCAERFNHTIMDKAQSMHFDACLLSSWWEFCVEQAVHLYNWTPVL